MAPQKQQKREAQNQKTVVEREIDEAANHYCSTVFCSTSALAPPGRRA
jgi:hypothetical protein